MIYLTTLAIIASIFPVLLILFGVDKDNRRDTTEADLLGSVLMGCAMLIVVVTTAWEVSQLLPRTLAHTTAEATP